ncbi:hypothetical protein GS478_23955, partial [Rhodococcus hoagii]|nr:hypothetical protein [Prescottella equi]
RDRLVREIINGASVVLRVVHHLADLMPLIASELETELHIVLLDQQEDGTLVRGNLRVGRAVKLVCPSRISITVDSCSAR